MTTEYYCSLKTLIKYLHTIFLFLKRKYNFKPLAFNFMQLNNDWNIKILDSMVIKIEFFFLMLSYLYFYYY